jgi:class 3 adenylate cyclase
VYESFAQGEIARLEELRQAAVEDRIDADLASGDHAALVAELDGMVREHPLRERLTGQLMLALYRSGRQAEALEAYRRARVRLQDELGLEPGPALKALQMQILEQAASLDWATTPRSEAVGATPPDVQLAVALPAVPRSERKVVTVVSIERVDVLARGERDDPEDMLAQLAPYHERLQVELERFGGTLLQVIGEELTALFGAPKARGTTRSAPCGRRCQSASGQTSTRIFRSGSRSAQATR